MNAVRLIKKLLTDVPQSAHRGKRPRQKVRKERFDSYIKTSEPTKRLRGIAAVYITFRQNRVWRELGATIAEDIRVMSARKGFLRRFMEDKEPENV